MITDFLEFLKTEWRLVSNNAWTFIIFGVFLFIIGYLISWKIHNYFLETKLHRIPDSETLQRENEELREKIKSLEEKLHKKKVADLVQQYREPTDKSIGEVIVHNKSADNTTENNL